jgi:hypothetical protein
MTEDVNDFDYDTPAGKYRRWIVEIEQADQWCNDWYEIAKRCLLRYRNEQKNSASSDNGNRRLNIFWSNVSTLQPALYARRPKPVVDRRFKDADPIGRTAAEVLERAVTFATDSDQFDEVIKQARDDRLIVGRGTAWLRYVPHFETMQPPTPSEGVSITDDASEYEAKTPEASGDMDNASEYQEDAPQKPDERLVFEEVAHDYVAWVDFLMSPAKTWREVRWVARRVQMTRHELVERFGKKIGNAVPLNARLRQDNPDSPEARFRDGLAARAEVFEIWDKSERKVCWVAKGYEALLDEREDPLRLREFFPCPKPLFATITTDSLIPTPDFMFYKDQANDLDDVTFRLSKLTEACRVSGVYDASQDASIERLFKEGTDNTLIPVNTWAAFADKGGLRGVMDFVPLEGVIATIRELTGREQALKAQIYEITGISDIVRGYSAPSETATAQQIKGQFAALRLQEQQAEVARFARDLIAMTAEVIAEHFQPKTIALMSGLQEQAPEFQQAFMPAVQLLRQDAMRSFRIEIETDSTIAVDEQADKQAATEFLTSIGNYMASSLPMTQQAPELLPVIGQGAVFLARRFRAGRQLEGAIDQAFQALEQRAQQMAQQPQQQQPDAAMLKAQADEKRLVMEAEVKGRELMLREQELALNADLKAREMGLREAEMAQAASLEAQRLQDGQAARAEARQDAFIPDREAMLGENEAQMRELATALAALGQTLQMMQQQQTDTAQVQMQALVQLAASMTAPKRVVRGPDGRAMGVETVVN